MRRIPTPLILTLILSLTFSLLAGCGGSDAGAQKMEVRVYQVPPDSTNALMQTLNKVFETGDKTSLGKVSSPSPGQLVVLAPASLQGSVEASLRALSKDSAATPSASAPVAAAKPDAPLRLSFWCVDAIPEAGDDDAALAALAPALNEARKQFGAVHFELRDEVSGVTSLGKTAERSWISGAVAGGSPRTKQLQYILNRGAGGLELFINFGDQIPVKRTENGQATVQYSSAGINTTTAIRLGQTLVVTQNPIPDSESTSATPGTLTRLYLVRVDEVPAA